MWLSFELYENLDGVFSALGLLFLQWCRHWEWWYFKSLQADFIKGLFIRICLLYYFDTEISEEYLESFSWKARGLHFISWWRHRMKTFSALLALREGNPPVIGRFLSQRPVTRSFDIFFDLQLDKRLSKQRRHRWFETPSRWLWRHCNESIPWVHDLVTWDTIAFPDVVLTKLIPNNKATERAGLCKEINIQLIKLPEELACFVYQCICITSNEYLNTLDYTIT